MQDTIIRETLKKLEAKLVAIEGEADRTRKAVGALRHVLGLSHGENKRVAKRLGRHRAKCAKCTRGFLKSHNRQAYCSKACASAVKNERQKKYKAALASASHGPKKTTKVIVPGDPLRATAH